MYYIENETEEDRTARLLRRIPIAELESKAESQGIFTPMNKSYNLDKDFLYLHGYLIEEYFEASLGVKIHKANREATDHLRETLKKRFNLAR